MNQENDFQGIDRDISVHGLEKVLLEILERCENEQSNINRAKAYSYFYKPSEELINTLKSFKESLQILNPTEQERQNRGYLLEKLARQSFRCLSYASIFITYQSAGGPQYDLIVSSDDSQWRDKILQSLFYVKNPLHNDHIVVECKAQSSKVNDQVFSRLCCIMDHNIRNSGIGIFFSLKGATGFPESGDSRQSKIGQCKLRQIIYYARCEKYILVLDEQEILSLDQPGSLVRLIRHKIKEIFLQEGIKTEPVHDFIILDNPPEHLA